MRGGGLMQESLFVVPKLDDLVPGDHPLRAVRVLVNELCLAMNARVKQQSAGCANPHRGLARLASSVQAHHGGQPIDPIGPNTVGGITGSSAKSVNKRPSSRHDDR